ncbi:Ctr copper transporter [Fistulina hepatica ATCC 64428]|uniref:Copper transport protein n=1 Tax=Fistulina hepatica ATCC 64428 TaxID=1128425 RepID=A0A0D7AGZ3_9AGAR|nr:Ctr copper transporter [Fistulina hepatica ATCC 64428]
MPMGPKCSMNMLCWHISTTTAFVFSCIAIIALSSLYEYLRVASKALDVRIARSLSTRAAASGRSVPDPEETSLLSGRHNRPSGSAAVPPVPRVLRAIMYGVSVFLSFFLMLIFMTYNAYLIFSVVLGAAIGHYIFGSTINLDVVLAGDPGKGLACH